MVNYIAYFWNRIKKPYRNWGLYYDFVVIKQ